VAAAGALRADAGAALAQASPCAASVVTSPPAGQVVSGAVRILGSASIDRFRFYKLEWARAEDPETWIATSTVISSPVRHGVLDRWDTVGLAAGAYRLKLTVVDEDSQERCRFVVEPLRIAPAADAGTPSPTAAPLPTARPGDAPARPSAPTPDVGAPTERSADAGTQAPADAASTAAPPAAATLAPTPSVPAVPDAAAEASPPLPPTSEEAAPIEAPVDEPSAGESAPDAAAGPSDDPADVASAADEGASPGLAASLGARARSGFLVGFAAVVAIALAAIALRARPSRR